MENVLTAVEARKLADNSEKFVKRVYKLIKDESADFGHTSLNYCIFGASDVLIEKLVKDLEGNGYKTEIHYGPSEWDETIEVPECIQITW